MNQFKEKYLTRYQRLRFALKSELKKSKKGFISRLKIWWYKSAIERIRINQIARGEK